MTYPKIRVDDAIEQAGGKQADLARALGYTRSYINKMQRYGYEYLPELAARKFVDLYGKQAA